jgi:hypothetical protein
MDQTTVATRVHDVNTELTYSMASWLGWGGGSSPERAARGSGSPCGALHLFSHHAAGVGCEDAAAPRGAWGIVDRGAQARGYRPLPNSRQFLRGEPSSEGAYLRGVEGGDDGRPRASSGRNRGAGATDCVCVPLSVTHSMFGAAAVDLLHLPRSGQSNHAGGESDRRTAWVRRHNHPLIAGVRFVAWVSFIGHAGTAVSNVPPASGLQTHPLPPGAWHIRRPAEGGDA